VPWSRKSRAIPLLSLWAVRPLQILSACTTHPAYCTMGIWSFPEVKSGWSVTLTPHPF